MRFRLLGALLLLGMLFALPTPTNAQKRKPGKEAAPAETFDSVKLPAGEYKGVLVSMPGSDRMFIVSVENKKVVYTGKGVPKGNNLYSQLAQAQMQMQQAQIQMQTARNAREANQARNRYQQAAQRYQQAMARANFNAGKVGPEGLPPGYKFETTKYNVEFQHTAKVKVRTMILPEEFDDKGMVKTYTDAEKAKLRGKDKTLPGYESSLDKLAERQEVTVRLASVKVKAKAKPKEGEEVVEDPEKAKQANVIIITKEATEAPAPRKKRKKG